MPLADLTTTEIVAISVAVVAVAAFFSVWLFLSFKKGSDTPEKRSPVVTVSILCFVLSAMIWFFYLIGVIPEDRKTMLLVANAALIGLIVWMYWHQFKKRQPKPMSQIEEEEIIPFLQRKYHVVKYGGGHATYRTTYMNKRFTGVNFRGDEVVEDIYVTNLWSQLGGVVRYLTQFDALQKHIILDFPDPPQALVNKLIAIRPGEASLASMQRVVASVSREEDRLPAED